MDLHDGDPWPREGVRSSPDAHMASAPVQCDSQYLSNNFRPLRREMWPESEGGTNDQP